MLNLPSIRYRQREVEERRRGASVQSKSASGLLLQMLGQVVRAMPWTHLGLALGVALLAGLIPWATGTALDAMDRQITNIAVDGELRGLRRTDLNERLQPWLGRSFFASDLEEVKAALEAEPWVDTAAVRRVWPGELRVEVREHVPIAFWNGKSLVTRNGEVISPDSVAAAGNLPHLSGPDGSAAEVLSAAQSLSKKLAVDDLRIAALSQEARGAWTLRLDNGITVELGRDRTALRLERFLSVYRSHLKIRIAEVAGVDARYSNGIAVRWKDAAQENI